MGKINKLLTVMVLNGKNQLTSIMIEKYNGKMRQVWSYELSHAIKDYMDYYNQPNAEKKGMVL